MMHLRHIGQLEAYIEEEHAGQRHTITAILPREEVEEMYRRLSGEMEAALFDAIAHGDDQHRAWLQKAIADHFAGREVERPTGGPSWRCFHCDEVFTDPQLAQDHFGLTLLNEPVCQIKDLAHLLRMQEYELSRFRDDDSKLGRVYYALGAEHHVAMRREEEAGYARGLADGRACPTPKEPQP